MSIHGKLQDMMTSKEAGTFFTKEKKQELTAINEAMFDALGTMGGDLGNLVKGTIKQISKAKSKIGTAINKIDIANFKKEHGVKDIEDIDTQLSTMKVNDPAFYSVMKDLMLVTIKSKKKNKELYDAVFKIFDKHLQRMVDYYETLLRATKDDKQGLMYYGILLDLVGWTDKVTQGHIRNDILRALSDYIDRKSAREILKQPEFEKKMKFIKDKKSEKPEKVKANEKDIANRFGEIQKEELANFSDSGLMEYIKYADEYLDEAKEGAWINKRNSETGLEDADLDEVGHQMEMADRIKYAISLLNRNKK